eukprot:CAMPEP_0175690244 /NCGR_PEP_ID=MMETSP0097-20121207/29793_1 /TAXON_ID=311494 /ORGANISM="Alexandrium monilatum, Strain CCMP3105" /LENGTH=343 /DNA_ID=CAMNT_0016997279 /DNA_START=24 /DNA_END=1052 /DNA_ORIENTATION=-
MRMSAGAWLAWTALAALRSAAVTPEEQVLSVRPLIVVVRNFASIHECQGVLRLLDSCHRGGRADCHELRSRLHAGGGNRSSGGQPKPWRNSTSFTLELSGELDEAVDPLVRRAHLLARHPITYGEGVQVASYQQGDYYEFHHDSLLRRATVLLYLTDVAEGDGGETIFPLVRAPGVPDVALAPLPPAVVRKEQERESMDFKVGRMEDMAPYCDSDFYLKIRPEAGTAVLFFSYRPDYSLDEYSIHGACPLRRGRKAILQRWMRFEENSLFAKADETVRAARSLWGHERLLPVGQPQVVAAAALSGDVPSRGTATLRSSTAAPAAVREGGLAESHPPGGAAALR